MVTPKLRSRRGASTAGCLVSLVLFVAAVYFVLCFAASQLVRRLQRRLAT